MITKSFFDSRYLKKIDQSSGEEKEIFLNPYTPPLQISKTHSIDCLSECSTIFFLQIEQKMGFNQIPPFDLELF